MTETTAQNDYFASDPDETSLGYMLRLSGPMIVTNISFTIMQFVDRLMVSRISEEALAAVLPAGIMSFLPASFLMGVMISVNTFVSQSLGRGEKDECAKYCWQAIYMGLIYFAIILAVMWPTAPRIFELMGSVPEVARMEVVYLRIMLYAQMVGVFFWASSQFFMGIHRPIINMYAAVIGQSVNVAANYVLIFGKLGFPEMGISGAGWGTFIGISVGASLRMVIFLNGDIRKTFHTTKTMGIDKAKMGDLLKVGVPAGISFMVNVAFWAMILVVLVAKFGTEAQAATTAVFACINVSVMPVVGIGSALTAAVGKSIGKGRKDVISKQTHVCLKVSLVYMGLIGLCFFLFRHGIMNFWSSDGNEKVIEAGVKLLVCAAIFQVFDAAGIIYNGALRGAGDTVWLAMISGLRAVIVLGMGGMLIVWLWPELGVLGPWIAATLSIIVTGIVNYWRFKSNKWMEIDLFKRRAVGPPVEVPSVVE
ncbi:MAG: MATE family efflux transporter [Planctomycetota bacterium]|jgi:MATE family multidrug resistance protein